MPAAEPETAEEQEIQAQTPQEDEATSPTFVDDEPAPAVASEDLHQPDASNDFTPEEEPEPASSITDELTHHTDSDEASPETTEAVESPVAEVEPEQSESVPDPDVADDVTEEPVATALETEDLEPARPLEINPFDFERRDDEDEDDYEEARDELEADVTLEIPPEPEPEPVVTSVAAEDSDDAFSPELEEVVDELDKTQVISPSDFVEAEGLSGRTASDEEPTSQDDGATPASEDEESQGSVADDIAAINKILGTDGPNTKDYWSKVRSKI